MTSINVGKKLLDTTEQLHLTVVGFSKGIGWEEDKRKDQNVNWG